MRYNEFKGLRVSEICFGTWGIGGLTPGLYSYGPKDDAVSRRALEVAYEQGINFYDTACSYGFGHSEKLLGQVFSSVPRQSVVLATKVGYLPYHDPGGKSQRFDAPSITASLFGSLLRLKTNYVDILQLHSPSWEDILNNPDLFDVLEKVREAGLVRLVGYAARNPSDAMKALYCKWFKFDTVQCNFNMTDLRAIDDKVFVACYNTGAKAMLRSPLLHGYLANHQLDFLTLHGADHRTRFTEATRARWLSAQRIFAPWLHDCDYAMAVNALRFCLSISDETLAVVTGMNTAQQVYANVKASDVPRFTLGDVESIIKLYREHFASYPVEMNKLPQNQSK